MCSRWLPKMIQPETRLYPVLRKKQKKCRYAELLSIYSAPGVHSSRNGIQKDLKELAMLQKEVEKQTRYDKPQWRLQSIRWVLPKQGREEGMVRGQQGLRHQQQLQGGENGFVFPSNSACGIDAQKQRVDGENAAGVAVRMVPDTCGSCSGHLECCDEFAKLLPRGHPGISLPRFPVDTPGMCHTSLR